MNIGERLAGFVAETRPEGIPSEARVQARRAVLDTLGVTLAGCAEPGSRIVAEWVREQGGAGESSVLGQGFRAPATEAALANGASGHALDYDDVNMSMRGHPSVPLLPAALAVGEKLGSSGRELVEAFVLGFEVEAKLGRVIGGPHYALGWHATSTFGSVGAAAACARLLKLDAERTQAALGIAASLASGLRQNFGTMTKPLHAGWAARNGVLAASLAGRGFTADAQALDGPNGFLRAASGGANIDPAKAAEGLGDPWEIVSPGIGVKLYPCCYATHRALDAALELQEMRRLDPSTIEKVRAKVSRGTLMPLIRARPESGLQGKFSLEYCLAAALLDGQVVLSSFSDEAVRRPEAQDLLSRVEAAEDKQEAAFPIGGFAEISALTRSGEEYTVRVEMPKGDPRRPLTWDELAAKFRDCAAAVLPPAAIEQGIAAIDALEELRDIGDLTAMLSGAASRL
ncbi:MAG: MmgE/PrpD family protein [Chloroflexi bacterium]|nr:MmgE/PrpD family protein [Chloroflexota bacterium]